MSRRRKAPDWPGLMKPATARAYLDEMPEVTFSLEVVPHLDRRVAGGVLHYTKASLDEWIDAGDRVGKPATSADLHRMIDDDQAALTAGQEDRGASSQPRPGRDRARGHRRAQKAA